MPDKDPYKNIVWLASYPKSGNTWLRVFLANYLFNTDRPIPLDQLHRVALGDAHAGPYRIVAKGSINPADEVAMLALRPAVLKAITANKSDINLVKTHNQNTRVNCVQLFPANLTKLAVYIIRNPLDMLLSYADHYGLPVATAAEAISSPSNMVVPGSNNVAQYLGNWSDHVLSWTRARDFPVLTLRYEDAKDDPKATFTKMLRRMGVPLDDARLERAIEFSSFGELRKQEDEKGFAEKSDHADRFFRSGESGRWRTELPAEVVERVCTLHGRVMKRHGYLP